MKKLSIYGVLEDVFKFSTFKAGQEKLIRSVLDKKDSLGVMPTGGGKSLCYQLPSLIFEGMVIVVSPLVSLMKDQVDSLKKLGIDSLYINSSISEENFIKKLELLDRQDYKIIYMAPDKLNNKDFFKVIAKKKISFLAVDEAHCISKFGHDYRPSYLEIIKFIDKLESRPVIGAYTGTASSQVIEDIVAKLDLNEPNIEVVGFDRPNLYYQVSKVKNKYSYVYRYLKKNFDKPGIIYCSTRFIVEDLAKRLEKDGISLTIYHGGLSNRERNKNQDDFIQGRKNVIICTNAFAMGIDKSDVRFVIHYNLPQNMEAYYQQSGRAGRDGKDASCILLFSADDIVHQKIIIKKNNWDMEREKFLHENLQSLVKYCNTSNCLRLTMLEYFGEDYSDPTCYKCGNCLNKSKIIDISKEAKDIILAIHETGQRYGSTFITQVLRGSKNKRVLEQDFHKIEAYGRLENYSEKEVKDIIVSLTSMDYIDINFTKYPILKLTEKSAKILLDEEKVCYKLE